MARFSDNRSDNRVSMRLEDTEKTLIDAASRILAAHISRGDISGDVRDKDVRDAVTKAIKMARMVDNAVHADDEK